MVRSRLSDLDIPEMPLHQLVSSMIGMYGDKTCCIDALSGVSLNYDKLKENIQKIASGLVRIGVQKGDVICFLAPNSIEHLQMFHGTLAAGAVVSAVNPSYTPFEIARQAKDAKAKYIFTLEGLAETAKKVKRDCHEIREVISTGHVSGCTPFIRLLSDDGEAFPFDMEFNVKEDIALLPYSSGTTGMPKGVMLTHYNIVSNLLQLAHPDAKDNVLDPMGPDDLRTIMAIAPFYHSYGMIGMLTLAVAGGARLIIVPKFTPKVFLTAIEKYKIRALPISPPLVVFLAKSPLVKSYDISSVKSMVSGAAPLASDIEDLVKSSMNLPFVKQGFGMTETTCASTMAPKDGFKSGSVGVIMANTEIEVRDVGTGKALGPNQRGELVIRGPQVMKGYLNRDEETRHCLRNGWLHTGDIGYYDDDENFFVVDRIKELIKVKGLQVAPAELESLLLSHPDIADSAVIGIPDERAGEVPRAYVVRRVGSNVTEHAIKDFVQGLVSRHKWLLGGVRFLDVIPKSENGKILRRILKAEALKELKSKL